MHICFILICFILTRNVLKKTNLQWSEKTESFNVLVIASILVLYFVYCDVCMHAKSCIAISFEVVRLPITTFMAHPPQVWVRVGLVGGLTQFGGGDFDPE